jgi:hypothetical protein
MNAHPEFHRPSSPATPAYVPTSVKVLCVGYSLKDGAQIPLGEATRANGVLESLMMCDPQRHFKTVRQAN